MKNEKEFADHSDDQKKTLQLFLDSVQIAGDFCRPYFLKFIRFQKLFDGIMPPELDGTFSKIMLHQAYAMIDNELPRSTKSLLSTSDWFNTEATLPEMELMAPQSQKWLRYQMDSVQKIAQTIVPTLQQVHLFGTGYRVYGHQQHKMRDGESTVVYGQYAGIFDVWPMPGGSLMNAFAQDSSAVCDGAIWWDYMKKSAIEAEVEKGNFDRNEVGKLLKIKSGNTDPTDEFKQQVSSSDFTTIPKWISTMGEKDSMKEQQRYRVGWLFFRDRWVVVAEDRFILYDGKPMYNCIPIAKFIGGYNLNDFFGKGLIEITEDLILSFLVLFNQRFDYLAGTLHPPIWASERILEHLGGDKTVLDPQPYQVLPYPNTVRDIQREIFHDRFPEISQQAFVEDGSLDMWMQKISGQPNYMKGVAGALSNDTSSGVMNVIAEGSARSLMRCVNIEESGLLDSLYLTLKLGAQLLAGPQTVRNTGNGGWPWENIPAEVLQNDYSLVVHGSRNLSMIEQTFRRMMEIAQVYNVLVMNPQIPPAFIKQLLVKSNAFENVDELVNQIQPAGAGMTVSLPGTPAGQTQGQNERRSVTNRNEVAPAGELVAAGNAIV